MLWMPTRLHPRIAAALIASATLIASGAQGLRYFRCASGAVSVHSCCPSRGEQRPEDAKLAVQQVGCCETLALPSPEPQEPQAAADASPLGLVARAPAVAARHLPWAAARGDLREANPPSGKALLLRHCSLLI